MTKPRTIAIAAQKGGVAKTTTCINLGSELAGLGQRVLIVDMDPQGHLAEGLGLVALEQKRHIAQVISDNSEVTLPDIIVPVGDNLWLAPSNILLATVELEMVAMVRREDRLKAALAAVDQDFDFVLIDCPPSLGLLTVNAFSAADEIMVPMSPAFFSVVGVEQLVDSIDKMRRFLNPDLRILGILPTQLDRRSKHELALLDEVRDAFDDIPIFSPPVPLLADVKKSVAAGVPLSKYSPKSPARLAYMTLAKEILDGSGK